MFDIDEAYPKRYRESKLFDLKNDPCENKNLIGDPAYEAVRLEMRKLLTDFMRLAHEPEAVIEAADAE